MPRKKRTDLIPEFFTPIETTDGNKLIIIAMLEPDPPHITVELGVFFSMKQILRRFRQNSNWLVNEKAGDKILSAINKASFLPERSKIPPRFAYGIGLEYLSALAKFYEKKADTFEKKLKKIEDDSTDELKQLMAPKDPKNGPN